MGNIYFLETEDFTSFLQFDQRGDPHFQKYLKLKKIWEESNCKDDEIKKEVEIAFGEFFADYYSSINLQYPQPYNSFNVKVNSLNKVLVSSISSLSDKRYYYDSFIYIWIYGNLMSAKHKLRRKCIGSREAYILEDILLSVFYGGREANLKRYSAKGNFIYSGGLQVVPIDKSPDIIETINDIRQSITQQQLDTLVDFNKIIYPDDGNFLDKEVLRWNQIGYNTKLQEATDNYIGNLGDKNSSSFRLC